ncbi:MAG: PKD domain-containing protein [bacterium]
MQTHALSGHRPPTAQQRKSASPTHAKTHGSRSRVDLAARHAADNAGQHHRIPVDATPHAGRTIASVKYYANNVEVGTTTATPHEFFYTVPANHPTNTQISIQAKAQDSLGFTGSSAFAYLDVKNDAPLASFTATITNTTTATVDASASSDTETAGADLEVCWDWDNNGTCDTAYSKTKITTHDFGASGTYTVRMVVRDAVGQTAETTR